MYLVEKIVYWIVLWYWCVCVIVNILYVFFDDFESKKKLNDRYDGYIVYEDVVYVYMIDCKYNFRYLII